MVLGILGFVSRARPSAARHAPEQWNKAGASQYLDRRGAEWFKFGSARSWRGSFRDFVCQLPQPATFCAGEARASPDLRRKAPTEMETKVLEQVKNRVCELGEARHGAISALL